MQRVMTTAQTLQYINENPQIFDKPITRNDASLQKARNLIAQMHCQHPIDRSKSVEMSIEKYQILDDDARFWIQCAIKAQQTFEKKYGLTGNVSNALQNIMQSTDAVV